MRRARDRRDLQRRAAGGFGADLSAVVRVCSGGALGGAEFDVDACHVGFGVDGLLKRDVFAGEDGRWAFVDNLSGGRVVAMVNQGLRCTVFVFCGVALCLFKYRAVQFGAWFVGGEI